MSEIIRQWNTATRVAIEHPAGLFVLVLAAAAALHTATGLGRTRQWYILPVVFGLTALAGFLLNPFADVNTAADLRSKLTSYETLTLLCIVQFVLLAVSLAVGLRMDGDGDDSRNAVGLAFTHAVPSPLVLIAMLLIEQAWLVEFPGARPESVGRHVGFAMAGGLALICAAAMLIPRRWLALPHHVLSIAMLLACMLVPGLQDPLPRPMAGVDLESLGLLRDIGLAAAALVLIGCCWPNLSLSDLYHRFAERLASRVLSCHESS